MSYLAQELVGFNPNYHPQDMHANDQETPPVSPASPTLSLTINDSSSLLKKRPHVPMTPPVATSKGEISDEDEDDYQEPVTKRISLRNNEDTRREELRRMQRQREDIHFALSGFSKISLPDVSTTATPLYPPPKNELRRTASDGQNVARGYFFNQEESYGYNKVAGGDLPRAVSQENFTFGTSNEAAPSQAKAEGVSSRFARSKSSLPPLPPPLRRTLSEPTPALQELFPKCTGDGSVAEQSPDTKRLEKMRLRLREMSERWAQVLREADGVEVEEDQPVSKVPGVTTEEDEGVTTETEIDEMTQEAVSVEMLGECLSINFSCPCNKGYQILLAGKNCYYKLV